MPNVCALLDSQLDLEADALTSTSAPLDRNLALPELFAVTNPANSYVNVHQDSKVIHTNLDAFKELQLLLDVPKRILVQPVRCAFQLDLNNPSAPALEDGSVIQPPDSVGMSTNVSNLQLIDLLAASGPSVKTCPAVMIAPAHPTCKEIRSRVATSATVKSAAVSLPIRSSPELASSPDALEALLSVLLELNVSL